MGNQFLGRDQRGCGPKLTIRFHLVLKKRMCGAIPFLLTYGLMTSKRKSFLHFLLRSFFFFSCYLSFLFPYFILYCFLSFPFLFPTFNFSYPQIFSESVGFEFSIFKSPCPLTSCCCETIALKTHDTLIS